MWRPLLLLLLALAATAAGGCGDEPPEPVREPVRLTFSAPRDTGTTSEATVQVSGSVAPATSRVLVLGERVPVSGGRFSKTVDLRQGSNVIDVGASAPGARATWRALRVTRRSKIELPELAGREEAEAKATLEQLELDVRVAVDEDLLDAFRRGPRLVCSSIPDAGSKLDAGSEVELVVSKSC